MSLHVQCETPTATLLVAVADPQGILRFPNDPLLWPGLTLTVNVMLGINSQLKDRATKDLGEAGNHIEIWQEYSSPLLGSSGVAESTLYVSRLADDKSQNSLIETKLWPTLPELIRTLPKDRNRLAYLKAWQVLSGGLQESTKALDVEEVVKHLKSLHQP